MVYYSVIGSGIPLVLLHGNGQSQQAFKKQITYFKDKYQLILIDTRGHGKSPLGRKPLTFELLAKDVLHVLNRLHIKKAAVLGYSDGGNIALQLSIMAPERLLASVVISGNLYPKGLKPLIYNIVTIQYHLLRMLCRLHIKVRRQKELAGLMANHPRIAPKELSFLRLPTLIIAGSSDIVRDSHTRTIAESIPGSSLVIVNHADHSGLFTHADEYNFIIRNYLEGVL